MRPRILFALSLAALASGATAATYEQELASALQGYGSHKDVPITVIRDLAERYDTTASTVYRDFQFAAEEQIRLTGGTPAPVAARAPAPAPARAPAPSAPIVVAGMSNDLLPPNPQAGHCYARVLVPASYQTENRQMLKAHGASSVAIRAPRFQEKKTQVLVREATTRYEVQDPVYEWVEERMLVSPAATKYVEVAAQYETRTEKIEDVAAHQVWKKGSGPLESLSGGTGEIMCLVDVPATYKTVTKRVLIQPATVKEVNIPAKYKMVKRKSIKEAAKVVPVEIPAEYATLTVREEIAPAAFDQKSAPDQYQTVSHRTLVNPAHLEWREVLCETNITPSVTARIQEALKARGYDPGAIDGVIGAQSRNALVRFQKDKGLASGNITAETVTALGVRISAGSILD